MSRSSFPSPFIPLPPLLPNIKLCWKHMEATYPECMAQEIS